ncbi:MAG: hypothetical protein R3E58_10980 [Phycisphaerae bacterium]
MPNDSAHVETHEAADTGLRCPLCEYNHTGLDNDLCPECGQPFDRKKLLAELDAVNQPIPIWSQRTQLGTAHALLATILTIWFRPIHFAKRFPVDADAREAFIFSNWCMGLALALMIIPFASRSALQSEPLTCLLISIGIVVGILICEMGMTATLFSGNDFEFDDAFALARMSRAYFILGAPLIANHFITRAVFGVSRSYDHILEWSLYGYAGYWWLSVICIATTYRKHIANLILSILMLPVCVFVAFVLSSILVGFTATMVFIIAG